MLSVDSLLESLAVCVQIWRLSDVDGHATLAAKNQYFFALMIKTDDMAPYPVTLLHTWLTQ